MVMGCMGSHKANITNMPLFTYNKTTKMNEVEKDDNGKTKYVTNNSDATTTASGKCEEWKNSNAYQRVCNNKPPVIGTPCAFAYKKKCGWGSIWKWRTDLYINDADSPKDRTKLLSIGLATGEEKERKTLYWGGEGSPEGYPTDWSWQLHDRR
jgi:hypothetical protein